MSMYERFEKKSDENIQEMFTRFTNITNELVSLGRKIPNDEQVRKILRSMPTDEKWGPKVTAIQETKDFTTFSMEQLAGSLMTHEMHLGTTSGSSRFKNIALKAAEEDGSDIDEDEAAMIVRNFKRMFNRNFNKKKTTGNKGSGSKSKYECHKCGSPDHFIKDCPQWEIEKGKGKTKEQARNSKFPFSKSESRKAMIAAWGDTDSEESIEDQPEEEVANLCLMASTSSDEKHKAKTEEVMFDYNSLKSLSKQNLIDLLIDTVNNYNDTYSKMEQAQKAVIVCKEHTNWMNTFHADLHERFFNLFDKNRLLQEDIEVLKNENILLNVELSEYKLFLSDNHSCEKIVVPIWKLSPEIEKLKTDLELVTIQKQDLEKEIVNFKNGKEREVPKWILNAQARGREGLGFTYKKKGVKQKKYVDLPSSKVCMFCGKIGHFENTCSIKESHLKRNEKYAKQVWLVKSKEEREEPKKDGAPETNN